MYVLDVRLPLQLLQSIMLAFQGDTTTIELAGNLSQLDIKLLTGVIIADDNCVAQVPLTEGNVKTLAESVLPRVGIRTKVYQIEIKRGGKLLFAAFDNFDQWLGIEGRYNKGAGVTSIIDVKLLDELLAKGVIRKYLVAEDSSGWI